MHEDVFEATDNLTDANQAGGRTADEPSSDSHLLLGAPSEAYPGGVTFAGLKLGKRYVSYYLMSVYLQPDTVISPELTKRRQGKSCFNAHVDRRGTLRRARRSHDGRSRAVRRAGAAAPVSGR